MFITVLGQKEASPRAMEQRRSLSFVLTLFLALIKPIGLPESRHEGRLSGKGTLGRKSIICRDGHSYTEAHYAVLQNSTLAARYIEEHKKIVRSNNTGKNDDWIRKEHMKTFGDWLQAHIVKSNTFHEL